MSDTLPQVDVLKHGGDEPGSGQQPAAASSDAASPRPRSTRPMIGAGYLLRMLIGCLIGGLLIDTWLVQGLFTPATVTSGSMAPAFLSPHCDVVCPGCGIVFSCEADDFAPSNIVCPNCCHRGPDFNASDRRPGDRLLVDRTAFVGRMPQRWETVVFRLPGDAAGLCIKRVVGLPGEAVEIRGGDVFVDGQIARKSIPQFRKMAILVHDEDDSSSPRWHGELAGSQWRCEGGQFEHAGGSANGTAEIDWHSYQHRQPSAPEPAKFGQVLDDLAYNPAESRILNPVRDLLVRCRIASTSAGRLWLRAQTGRDQFVIKLDLNSGLADLTRNGVAAGSGSFSPAMPEQPAHVEFGIIDQQLWLTVAGQTVLAVVLNAAQGPASPRPFSIGAQGGKIQVSHLQIWRDVYYLSEPAATVKLGPGDLFVLGDNSPQSEDSRQWGASAVTLSDLVGKPYRAAFDQTR